MGKLRWGTPEVNACKQNLVNVKPSETVGGRGETEPLQPCKSLNKGFGEKLCRGSRNLCLITASLHAKRPEDRASASATRRKSMEANPFRD